MGCIPSKPNINDVHPNIFPVINVDDRVCLLIFFQFHRFFHLYINIFQGNATFEGHIKVTETSLELFRRGVAPIRWPFKSLRRYGGDEEQFTFEAGRRCPTGPGVYAFRCSRAPQLFNLVHK